MSIQIQPSSFSLKWSLVTVASYFVLTIIGSIILSSIWLASNSYPGASTQDLAMLMEKDRIFAIYSGLLGASAAIFCGYFITCKSAQKSFKAATYIAMFLAAYGALSIVLHPEHHFIQQIGKLTAPFIFCGLGAWLALRRTSNS